MDLPTLWFLLIALLWTGYLILEGFDFGVGMLLPVLGRRPEERDALVRTFGPVWDGNEVWLLVAGGAMFAAFPNWYASMFSAMYLPLLILLVALIVRVLAIEYRRKHDGPRWTARWDRVLFVASVAAPLMAAVGLANVVHGIPMDANHDFTGSLLDLLNPYSLLGGVAVLALFALHGATFLGLRTAGDLRPRARALALRIWPVATLLVAAFGLWTLLGASDVARDPSAIGALAVALAVVGLVATGAALRLDREAVAFAGTALTIAAAVVLLFAQLWPNVLPSTDDPAGTLTIAATASQHYTLKVMTIVAILVTPVVLLYQGWSYWVFRHRVSAEGFPEGGAGAALRSLHPGGDS
ncbi:cytochrome d ubiquinol oxidase subunit II [Patulibacter defluvii]|uniref:cytochrome d ubiquinol oxidase subunit II n=1 Tax=Patulibacter defluvii TaxID=3095358 RepID=UPI002A761C64|nr:cytochrome d ubiquinol oxidase subunit II [Patulibacter sp. DM4]